MNSYERKILIILLKEKSLHKDELIIKIKNKHALKSLDWLMKNDYILKKNDLSNKEVVSITPKGDEYFKSSSSQNLKKLSILITAIVCFIGILNYFSNRNKETKPNEINQLINPTSHPDTTYYIENYISYKSLIDSINTSSNLSHEINSKNIIKFTYSGEIEKLEENSYYYPGGALIIKYNQEQIKLNYIKINHTAKDGAPMIIVNDAIDKWIIQRINQNTKKVSEEIINILTTKEK